MNIYNRLIYTGKCKPRLVCNRYMVLFINYIIPTSLTLKCLMQLSVLHKHYEVFTVELILRFLVTKTLRARRNAR